MIAGRKGNGLAEWIGQRAKKSITGEMINASRDLRLAMLDDPHRPAYHFVIPEDFGGPFELKAGEMLSLRVFVDKSIVEVFANERQVVTRRIYPTRDDSVNVSLFSNGGPTEVTRLRAWEMMPSNPY